MAHTRSHDNIMVRALRQGKIVAQPVAQALDAAAQRRISRLLGIEDFPNPKLVITNGIKACRVNKTQDASSMMANERHLTAGRSDGQVHCPYCRIMFRQIVNDSHNGGPVATKRSTTHPRQSSPAQPGQPDF